ncbi:RDD family protein [Streptomyces sp. TRM 70351]|uniref:RDD family protein n=1 Tax=Streptomyces sp. TRM 70351 TaxID=3116552 RepID=UPI002E7BD24B|nr:RDD family protein [Streptomyces sp. TRM 70351]MEE1928118.1 RDD family protein [Streptomyces sp. TRM 70351]
MSTDQPQPGGEPPGDDPFRKPPPSAPPPPGAGGGHGYGYGGGEAYGSGPGAYGDVYGPPDPLAGMPPLASRGKRLLARIVDAFVVGVPVFLIGGLLFGTWAYQVGASTDENAYDSRDFALSLIYTAVYFLYEGWMLTTRGQTLGKMALRIRVGLLDDGAVPEGNPGWFRAAVYNLPAVIPCLGSLFWLVNVVWCTWDRPYQQCLHDKAVKTVVVEA